MTWPARQLRDFILIKHGFAFASQHFGTQGTHIVLTPGHFYEEGGFRSQIGRQRFLTVAPPRRYVLKKGAMLVAMTEQAPGLLGSCAVVPEGDRFLHNQRLGLIEITQPAKLSADFLYYVLNSPQMRKQIHAAAGGTKVRHTSPDKICAAWFRCPPLDAQTKIAAVLRALDTAIEAVRHIVDPKRRFKRGLVRQLLVRQRRFPEWQDAPWQQSRLSNHVREVTRKNTTGATLVLTASGEHGLVDQRRYFNRAVAGADLSQYYLLKRGEFAYNRSAMNGFPYGATKRLDEHEEGVLSTLYLCFAIVDSNLDSDYLKHVFESGVLDREIRPIVRVGARAHGLLNVTGDDFLSVSIPLPKLKEQRRIAEILNALDREIELTVALKGKIETLKRALLARLLSGDMVMPIAA